LVSDVGKILIGGRFVINESLTLSGIAVELGQGAEIVVNQGVTFTANKSTQQQTQFYSCQNNYWLGIENLGTIQFNEVILENALSGIFNRNSGRSRVELSCFNENDSHIVVLRTTGTSGSADNSSNNEGPVYLRGNQFRSDKPFSYRQQNRTRNYIGVLYLYGFNDFVTLSLGNDFIVGVSSSTRVNKNVFSNFSYGIALGSFDNNSRILLARDMDINIQNNIFRNSNRITPNTYNAACHIHLPVVGINFQKVDFPQTYITNCLFDNLCVGVDYSLPSYSVDNSDPLVKFDGYLYLAASNFKNISTSTPNLHTAAVSLGTDISRKPLSPFGVSPNISIFKIFNGASMLAITNKFYNSTNGIVDNMGGQHFIGSSEFVNISNIGIHSPDNTYRIATFISGNRFINNLQAATLMNSTKIHTVRYSASSTMPIASQPVVVGHAYYNNSIDGGRGG